MVRESHLYVFIIENNDVVVLQESSSWLGSVALKAIVLRKMYESFSSSSHYLCIIPKLIEERFEFWVSLEDLCYVRFLTLGKLALYYVSFHIREVVQGYSRSFLINLLSF